MTQAIGRETLHSTGIQTLSFDELDAVAGGPLPLAVPIVTGLIGLAAGVAAARSTDDCTTYTRQWTDQNGVTHTVVQKVCS